MVRERILSISQEEFDQLATLILREAGADSDMLQRAGIIEESQQQRADRGPLAGLMPAKAGNHAVAIALVLYLEHHALIGFVGACHRLRHDPVKTGALEAVKPVRRDICFVCCRRDVNRRRGRGEQRLQRRTPGFGWPTGQIAISLAKQVKEDHGRRCLLGEQLYPGCSWMNAQLECFKIQTTLCGDYNFAVEYAAGG